MTSPSQEPLDCRHPNRIKSLLELCQTFSKLSLVNGASSQAQPLCASSRGLETDTWNDHAGESRVSAVQHLGNHLEEPLNGTCCPSLPCQPLPWLCTPSNVCPAVTEALNSLPSPALHSPGWGREGHAGKAQGKHTPQGKAPQGRLAGHNKAGAVRGTRGAGWPRFTACAEPETAEPGPALGSEASPTSQQSLPRRPGRPGPASGRCPCPARPCRRCPEALRAGGAPEPLEPGDHGPRWALGAGGTHSPQRGPDARAPPAPHGWGGARPGRGEGEAGAGPGPLRPWGPAEDGDRGRAVRPLRDTGGPRSAAARGCSEGRGGSGEPLLSLSPLAPRPLSAWSRPVSSS